VFQHLSDDLKSSCTSQRTVLVSVDFQPRQFVNRVFMLCLMQVSAIHSSKSWSDSLYFAKRKKHSQASFYSSRQCLLFHCIFYIHSLLN